MIRLRRILLIALSAVTFVIPVSAQPTARADEIVPISPLHNAVLTNNPPQFSFMVFVADQNGPIEGPGYTVYLHIKSTDGTYKYKEELNSAICSVSCDIIPDDPDYQLVDGTSYKWWVIVAHDLTGDVIVAMPKQKFTIDLDKYETKIALEAPADESHLLVDVSTPFLINFQFASHGLPEHRLKIFRTSGTLFYDSGWALPACINSHCSLPYTFQDMSIKSYNFRWKVFGRFPDVTGKAKSNTHDLTLTFADGDS